MKIALVHSFYASETPSGENEAVRNTVSALQEAGHEVSVVGRHTDELSDTSLFRIRAGLRVASGRGASPSLELERIEPDIVHVHNLFPNFATAWLRSWTRRTVTTLHNFRTICANGLLFRDGEICMKCPEKSSIEAVRHKCYRRSRVASIPAAIQSKKNLKRSTLLTNSSRVIVLSEQAQDIFIGYGCPRDRTVVVPNGIPSASTVANPVGNGRWLAVGRLSEEKGFRQLLLSWPDGFKLDVVGDGPLRLDLQSIRSSDVKFLGPVPNERLRKVMNSYDGLVFPSVCLEMQPTVVIEAMSVGLPIVARSGNAGAHLVMQHNCGRQYETDQELKECLQAVRTLRQELGRYGRLAFNQHYSLDAWSDRLTAVYTEVAMSAALGDEH